jgi:hypothetical protein
MKYIYYTNNNGDISMISPVLDSTTSDPYITVSDAEGDQFMTGELLQHDYFIDLDLKTIKKKYRPTFNQPRMLSSNKIYSVPLCAHPEDFSIVQNVKNKTIQVSLGAPTARWWKENDFFNQPNIYLIACVPNDPHLVLWDWIIPSNQLSETPVVRSYANPWGTMPDKHDPMTVFESDSPDQIRFYTRKIFESYSHEQSN